MLFKTKGQKDMKKRFWKMVESYHAVDEKHTTTWWHTAEWLPDTEQYDNKLLDLHLKGSLP